VEKCLVKLANGQKEYTIYVRIVTIDELYIKFFFKEKVKIKCTNPL